MNNTQHREVETRAVEIATEARTRIETHEQVCAERYSNITQCMNNLKELIEKYQEENRQSIKGLYNRFWAIASGVVAVLIMMLFAFFKAWIKLP